ncbi:MAG: glycogen synthase [Desulfobacterota bacterium]|nr:glycogen synthase [Thermodesulfobacteriota bacterium]
MRILFATSEVAPFSRAGGLADVSQALPLYLARLGHEVIVVTPKYRFAQPLKPAVKNLDLRLEVPISWMKKSAQVFQSSLREPLPVYLIGRDDLYDREGLYGNEYGDYQDNAERFIFFSRAVLELCAALKWRPDVIHCHDWQTGLIPVYLKALYGAHPELGNTATLFTIHNLGYQGLFWHYDLHLTGLGWELFTPQGLEFFGKINLMKGGIIFADILNTVSPTYRREILTPENGFGLEGVLQNRSGDLYAVLDGVDYEIWNPENDPHLPAPFSAAALENKKVGKARLQERFQLKRKSECPIVAVISRLLDRKGLDLIRQVFTKLMDLDMEVVVMGQIQGGADMLLMPSRYEPCGLDQMYALKYGTIPIVRAVGGLDDTVEDYNPQTDQGTGFKFRDYEADKLLQTVQRALAVYRDKPRWSRLIQRAMAQDFSWARSAVEYQGLYQKAAAGKRNP